MCSSTQSPGLRNMYFHHLLPNINEAMVVIKKFNLVSFFLIFETHDFVFFILFYFMGFVSLSFFFFFVSLMSFTLMTMEGKSKSIENKNKNKKEKIKKQDQKKYKLRLCFFGELRRLDLYVNVIQ